MTKKELRIQYKQQRLSISSKDKLKFDDLLLIQFQKLSFENVNSLFTYFPMDHYAEPNTVLFSSYMRHIIPGLQMAYPVCNMHNYTMQAFAIDEDTVYEVNNYGTAEPKSDEILLPESIDLVFVPLLICDNKGFRVGYGKGFYDKFLAQCRSDILKIGFGYFDPVESIDDLQHHDIPLDYYITPHSVYEF